MSTKAWEAEATTAKKRESFMPTEEDIAESRRFIQRLFEEHYGGGTERKELQETDEKPSSEDMVRPPSGR